jgi:hypothetical protein
MRLSGIRLPLMAAVATASVGLFVWATDRSYGDTLFLLPTTTTIANPYVIPTTYAVSSSYVFPTSYVETAYTVAPSVSLFSTGYIETTYRRGLFGRRYIVERPVVASYPTAYVPTTYVSGYVPTTYVSSYVPTTYVAPTYYSTAYRVRRYRPTAYTYYPTVYPTVYETAYTSSPDICCDEVVVDRTVRTVPQSGNAVSALSRAPKEVESGSMDNDYIDSTVTTPPLPEELARQRSTQRGNGAAADNTPRTPVPAAGDAEKAANKNATGAGGTPATKKAKPADEEPIDLQAAPKDEIRRDSNRPTYERLRTVDRRNILFGTVESEDRSPRGEVPVTVVNRRDNSIRRNGVSDAFGTFAIRVPDGDWTVRVTMPSGSTQAVRHITVRGGRVIDNLESREVQNLIISF